LCGGSIALSIVLIRKWSFWSTTKTAFANEPDAVRGKSTARREIARRSEHPHHLQREMRELNRRFRKKNKATDVLSFPLKRSKSWPATLRSRAEIAAPTPADLDIPQKPN